MVLGGGVLVGVSVNVGVAACSRFNRLLFLSGAEPGMEIAFAGAERVAISKAKSMENDTNRGNPDFIIIPILYIR